MNITNLIKLFLLFILMKNKFHLQFKNESSFIFDLREKQFNSFIGKIEDNNDLKPNNHEINKLRDKIAELSIDEDFEDKNNINSILPTYKEALIEFKPGIYKYNEKIQLINDIVNNFKKKENITLKNVCKKYNKISSSKISKSYAFWIFKNKLNLRYLKTVTKTNILNSNSSKVRSFFFIKAIIRALELNLKIIFLDESNFQLENNHLKIWRKKNELPYFKIGKKGRKNIIVAISNEELLLYKINEGTNTSNTFLEFMKNLLKIINEKNIADSLIIMDNCSIHMTKALKEFYKENKLKIMTIVPYSSEFNGVEFLFNHIKQNVYKKVFPSLIKLTDFVEKILSDDSINEIAFKIFIKTLKIYENYISNNINIDLNYI